LGYAFNLKKQLDTPEWPVLRCDKDGLGKLLIKAASKFKSAPSKTGCSALFLWVFQLPGVTFTEQW
jgi:hypothetical protein